MKFQVVVHKELAGGYWAEVPALPGCVSQGETLAELKANIHEAIEGCLEVLRDEGRQPEEVFVWEVEMTGLDRHADQKEDDFELPAFSMGRAQANLDDRDALEELLTNIAQVRRRVAGPALTDKLLRSAKSQN
jgi:predicted RNase H-like HicB family nuclease